MARIASPQGHLCHPTLDRNPRKALFQQPASREAGPQRRCVGCRESLATAELVRFRSAAGGAGLVADLSGTVPGRGAWLRPTLRCFRRAISSKGLQRGLRGLPASSFPGTEEALSALVIDAASKEMRRLVSGAHRRGQVSPLKDASRAPRGAVCGEDAAAAPEVPKFQSCAWWTESLGQSVPVSGVVVSHPAVAQKVMRLAKVVSQCRRTHE